MARAADRRGGLSKSSVHELFATDSLRVLGGLVRLTSCSCEPWAPDEDCGAFLARALAARFGGPCGWYRDGEGGVFHVKAHGFDPNCRGILYLSATRPHESSPEWVGTFQGSHIAWTSRSGATRRSHFDVQARTIGYGTTAWRAAPFDTDWVTMRAEFLRLFLMVHAEHTAGSVVTHTTLLLASAWCDPFSAYAAGILAFHGPLHGRANQEFTRQSRRIVQRIGSVTPSVVELERWVQEAVAAGEMIYGFGCKHPYPDPRYAMMVEFAEAKGLTSAVEFPMVALAVHLGRELPDILKRHTGVTNPYPNPDAISGVLLEACLGIADEQMHPALLAQARAAGAMAAASWHRMLGLPIERPASLHISLA